MEYVLKKGSETFVATEEQQKAIDNYLFADKLLFDTRERIKQIQTELSENGNVSNFSERDLKTYQRAEVMQMRDVSFFRERANKCEVPAWVLSAADEWVRSRDYRKYGTVGLYTQSRYAIREEEREM